MKSIQVRLFDEMSLRYMVGFQRQNQSGYSFCPFDASHISICSNASFCGRGAHVCASNRICSVDVDTVFHIYVDKTFQENVHILPASSWLFIASIASHYFYGTLRGRSFYLEKSILYVGSRIHLFPSIWLHRRVWDAICREISFIFDAGNKHRIL